MGTRRSGSSDSSMRICVCFIAAVRYGTGVSTRWRNTAALHFSFVCVEAAQLPLVVAIDLYEPFYCAHPPINNSSKQHTAAAAAAAAAEGAYTKQ
jgi:hypothetical protein